MNCWRQTRANGNGVSSRLTASRRRRRAESDEAPGIHVADAFGLPLNESMSAATGEVFGQIADDRLRIAEEHERAV